MAKTQVSIDTNIYNIKAKDESILKTYGLTEQVVREISKLKGEPDWILDIRLKGLKLFYELENPTWGPDLSMLHIEEIATYVKPNSNMERSWEDIPDEIKNTFDRLGIPEAEKKSLAGVGAQFDSEMVYHNLEEELKSKGVIYCNFDEAIFKYPELFKKYFMKAVPINDHKYIALHYALFSGGSFIYIPKGVKLDMPLQSYFRLNAPGAGQFEHTLIIVEDDASLEFIEGCSAPGYNDLNLHAGCVELFVGKNAYLRFSTIENWSRNMLNLNTKKCIVDAHGKIEWITGSFGSKISMLYPLSILNGEGATCEYTGISFAGKGQNLDTGLKVVLNAPKTNLFVDSKSISKDGGICTFRSNVDVMKNAHKANLALSCESLMLDSESKSDTIPFNDIRVDDITFSHEATIGKISDEMIFYLMSRGLDEEEAKALIVRGFAEPISKSFPVEYAVEMNRLINLELEGTIG
nr:Fe-S cluster assembly protein SufB [Bacilli bacterium]